MTFAATDCVISGVPYDVLTVAGQTPESLAHFVGETDVVLERGGQRHEISGIGSAKDHFIRFYEKDLDHAGKDIRIWHISEDTEPAAATGPRFTAEHSAAI